jgi:two-component system, OmpR family, sensor histidine kinase MprB
VSETTPDPGAPVPVRFRGTLASRVALLAALAVTASVVFGSAAAYAVVRHQLYASLDGSLLERAEAASQTSALSQLTQQDVPSWMLGAADIRIAVLHADRRVDYAEDPEDSYTIELGRTELEVARGQSPESTRTAISEGDRYRVAAVPGNEDGTALILAQSLGPTYDALGKLGAVLTLFGLLGIGLAGLLGWMVARSGLRPVRGLAEAVEDIARTEDLRPIPVLGHDEVARLAVAFNQTLGALDRSRTRQRQLVADAGHELRTPLTSLRTNLDLLCQAEDPSSPGALGSTDRAEVMADLRFQIDELTQLIGDLTELARQDAPEVQRQQQLDLAEVVERAVDRVRRRASTLHYDVDVSPWVVHGDPQALDRAITNLLDNAAKWSPPLGRVTVRLHDGVVTVLDQGPGIPEADLPHIFERFYRSPESRTMPGSGLGLAIVAKVAESHGGWVRAGSGPEGGAAFWVGLPGEDLTEPSHGPLSGSSATGRTLEP